MKVFNSIVVFVPLLVASVLALPVAVEDSIVERVPHDADTAYCKPDRVEEGVAVKRQC
ncbi:hypothetical protein F5884DRAFT_853065 [Xylogone sp. PMI_703]|nr:hypothetical protein F5884DRAFT_853065 [Xylogone sp. PMI_703]